MTSEQYLKEKQFGEDQNYEATVFVHAAKEYARMFAREKLKEMYDGYRAKRIKKHFLEYLDQEIKKLPA